MEKKEKVNWLKTVLSFVAETKTKMVISILCAIISVAGSLVPFVCAYRIIILFFDGTQTGNNILFWAVAALGGYIIQFIFHGVSTTLSHISAYTILRNMRLRVAERLMSAPLGIVMNQTAGRLKNIMIDHVETIELPLAHLIPEGISYLLLPVCVFIYLITIDWRMALASLITVPIAGAAYAAVMKTYNKQYAEYMESCNHVNGVIVEYVEGIEVIKAFNQSSSSYAKYKNVIESFKQFTLSWYKSTWKLMTLGASIMPSTLLGTMPIGMYLYLKGSLTPADFTISLILSLGIVGPLSAFTVFVNKLKTIEFAVNMADELLSLEPLPAAEKFEDPHTYDIVLKNVDFSYTQSKKAEKANEALSGISLKIPQNSFSALVGPSGGGKSTVARLIARFWDVSAGEITISGINIKNMSLSKLADTISFVTQDNFLFNCSLMENIRLGNPKATDEEVIIAAKAACCDEFIKNLDNGYNTTAGEAGGKLSGGERQRIAIARAILKNAPIVILDEATAFTDPENEDQLQKSIAALTHGKTLLVIAHRLSTIKNADQIIVLEKGHVVKTGTHGDLLNSCPLYRNMWDAHIGAKNWTANSGKASLAEGAVKKHV